MGFNRQKQKNQIFLLLICKEKPTLSKGVDLVANSAAAGTLNEEATFDLLLSMLLALAVYCLAVYQCDCQSLLSDDVPRFIILFEDSKAEFAFLLFMFRYHQFLNKNEETEKHVPTTFVRTKKFIFTCYQKKYNVICQSLNLSLMLFMNGIL